jgi:hypothetical protein
MMKTLAAIALAALLGGCVTGGVAGVQRDCGANARYLAMWDCIKSAIAQNRAGNLNNGPGLEYIATGDALASRVRSGTLDDAQAKLLLAQTLTRTERDYHQQQQAAGDALIAAGATLRDTSPSSITCQRWGSNAIRCQ